MGKNKIDMNDPALQFWQTDTIDKVFDPTTGGAVYGVFREDDGTEVVDGSGEKGTPDLYWHELTREEFKFLHPTIFQS